MLHSILVGKLSLALFYSFVSFVHLQHCECLPGETVYDTATHCTKSVASKIVLLLTQQSSVVVQF